MIFIHRNQYRQNQNHLESQLLFYLINKWMNWTRQWSWFLRQWDFKAFLNIVQQDIMNRFCSYFDTNFSSTDQLNTCFENPSESKFTKLRRVPFINAFQWFALERIFLVLAMPWKIELKICHGKYWIFAHFDLYFARFQSSVYVFLMGWNIVVDLHYKNI